MCLVIMSAEKTLFNWLSIAAYVKAEDVGLSTEGSGPDGGLQVRTFLCEDNERVVVEGAHTWRGLIDACASMRSVRLRR